MQFTTILLQITNNRVAFYKSWFANYKSLFAISNLYMVMLLSFTMVFIICTQKHIAIYKTKRCNLQKCVLQSAIQVLHFCCKLQNQVLHNYCKLQWNYKSVFVVGSCWCTIMYQFVCDSTRPPTPKVMHYRHLYSCIFHT